MRQRKDVLFLCQYFYPEYNSSATLPYDTAQALADVGLSVDAICGYPKEYNQSGPVPKNETYQGIGIKRLSYLQLERTSFVGRLINYFSFLFAVALRFGRLRRYKLIMVYSNPPMLPWIVAMASKLFGTKMIFVSYDIYPEVAIATHTIGETSMISKIMRAINQVVFKQVHKVVALSEEMKAYLLDNRESLKEDQIEVIPNWYEDKGVPSTPTPSKESLTVSYFGNMGTAQDLETLMTVIRNIQAEDQIKFIFAGHGNKMESLKQIVASESLHHVEVFDFLHGQDFQDALNRSDCFIVTLAEGITGLAVPSKTYSYMMAGKPVIAIMGKHSDIAKDLIHHQAGYAMEVGDTKALYKALIELRDNKEKRQLMGQNSREVFLNKYTKDICTGQYVKMVKQVLEEK